ncbi:hypothetical protein GCM10009745_52150 [Kribbella yunnanensis]|uniref:LPXTG cell wall anchor domain-containing protein n=1 Tax=Kribbella yunnanensis TaxID=190194 RepID=A0ABP4U8J1_9ACTN
MSYLSRRLAGVAAVLVVVLSGFFLTAGLAAAAVAPTPTPTATPNNPKDADADDYNRASWVVIGAVAVVVIIGAGTFWMVRSRRVDLVEANHPDDDHQT